MQLSSNDAQGLGRVADGVDSAGPVLVPLLFIRRQPLLTRWLGRVFDLEHKIAPAESSQQIRAAVTDGVQMLHRHAGCPQLLDDVALIAVNARSSPHF